MFGWVDFSESERKRTAEVLDLVRLPGAIDELGIGVLRDGFANKLFPGTSTLHTHARYYFLIAYLMKDLERNFSGQAIEAVREAYRQGEMETARKLLRWCEQNERDTAGITGSDYVVQGRWVKQTPTMMDWAAIQSYGLLDDDNLKLNGFLKLVSQSAAKTDDIGAESDDEGIVMTTGLWSVPLETYVGWRDNEAISLDMLEPEAAQLKRSICSKWPKSLYAALLKNPGSIERLSAECELEGTGKSFIRLVDAITADSSILPGFESYDYCNKAADISALVALLHIRFNCVLAKKAGVAPEEDACQGLWELETGPESVYLERAMRCDVREAFDLVGANAETTRNRRTYVFLKDAQAAIRQGDVDALDRLIEERELALKGQMRSKIANAKTYSHNADGAQNWFGGKEMTYRLSDALTLAREITEPLRGEVPC